MRHFEFNQVMVSLNFKTFYRTNLQKIYGSFLGDAVKKFLNWLLTFGHQVFSEGAVEVIIQKKGTLFGTSTGEITFYSDTPLETIEGIERINSPHLAKGIMG